MNASRRLALGMLLLLVAVLAPAPARAQGDQAAAQALFDQAKQLMDQGKYDEACPKFAESQRLDPGGGTLLNLATCHQKAGKTASAWEKFKQAAAAARREGRADRAAFAESHVKALEPGLSRLTVDVADDARVEGLVVTRDGVELGQPSWGLAIPVDPGVHTLAAHAPGHEPFETTVAVTGGASETVSVPALVALPEPPAPVPTPTAAPAAGTAPTSADGGAPPPDSGAGDTQRIAGWVIAGVGVAAAAVGGVFGVGAILNESDADAACGDGVELCSDQSGLDASKAAHLDAKLANGLIFGGLGVAAAGVVILLTAPSGAPEGQAAWLLPLVGPEGAGLGMQLAF